MPLDLKIVGGIVIDGSGAAGYTADVGIVDGRIVEVGRVTGAATRVIDADGAIVTPGFVDMHTHYDAQIMWDRDLLMSARHGVTTAIMGNCGVGVAPCRPEGRAGIISLLSGIEDVPTAAIDAGMRWDWQSFPDYLDIIDSHPRTIDVGAYVAHAPVRTFVMGRRGHDRGQADGEDRALIAKVVRDALQAGAVGFSTDRIFEHRMADGAHAPDYDAADDELLAIAAAVGSVPGRTFQFASDFHQHRGLAGIEQDLALIEAISAIGRCPISMQLLQWPHLGVDGWRTVRDRVRGLAAAGHAIRFEVPVRAIGVMIGLGLSLHPFTLHPSYAEIAHLPLAERAARMRDPQLRATMLGDVERRSTGVETLDQMVASMGGLGDRIYHAGGGRAFEPSPADSISALAARRGQTVMEAFYELLSDGEGLNMLYWPIRNFEQGDLEVVREMLADRSTMLSFGDAGAHASMICDSAYTTFALSYWARDRAPAATIPIERLVHMMSGAQAEYLSLQDRGRLRPGLRADVNVIDPAAIRLDAMDVAADLPGGCQRLVQLATGYEATLVAGTPIVIGDELTGARPGRLVRAGRS